MNQPSRFSPLPIKDSTSQNLPDIQKPIFSSNVHIWNDAPDPYGFIGRDNELREVSKLLSEDNNLIFITGMSGIGKTMFVSQLCKKSSGSSTYKNCIEDNYLYIFWQSLVNMPPLTDVLISIINLTSTSSQYIATKNIDELTTYTINLFKENKWLIILDNFDLSTSIEPNIYNEYITFLNKICNVHMDSRVIITGQIEFDGFSKMARAQKYNLLPLTSEYAKKIFEDYSSLMPFDAKTWDAIYNIYSGNPMFLRLLSSHIFELYQGDVIAFLDSGEHIFYELHEIFEAHYKRLSYSEISILFWLAILRKPVLIAEINKFYDKRERIFAQRSIKILKGRSLIENIEDKYYLQPAMLEFITEKLIEEIETEIFNYSNECFALRNFSLLCLASSITVQKMQVTCLIEALNKKLNKKVASLTKYKEAMDRLIQNARMNFSSEDNYLAGNLINIIANKNKGSIKGYNFSYLSIISADFQNIIVQNVDFSECVFKNCSFRHLFGPVSSVAITANGEYYASNEPTGKIHIWRLSDHQVIKQFDTHMGWIFGLEFSSDGKYLASGGEDKSVYLHDLWKQNDILVARHDNSVWDVAFSPDNKLLASAGGDNIIKVYDIETESLLEIPAHSSKIFSVAFSPTGKYLISASTDHQIKIWDVNNEFSHVHTIRDHTDTVRCVNTFMTSDNHEMLISCSWDESIRIWDLTNGFIPLTSYFHRPKDKLHYVAAQPNATTIAASTENGIILLWDYKTNEVKSITEHEGHEVWKVEFSQDGQYLITGGYDGKIIIWDTDDWSCNNIISGYIDWIQAFAPSKDGKYVACTNGDLSINIWSIEERKKITSFLGHSGWTFGIDYSNKDKYLATGSDDLKIKLWNPEKWDKENPIILNGHKKWIQCVAFDITGKYLASGDDDCVLNIWNVDEQRIIQTLNGHSDGIWAVAFSNDGKWLASAGEDATIILWDWRNNPLPFKKLSYHQDRIHGIIFSNEGKHLYSCAEDTKIIKWNIDANTHTILYSHEKWAMGITISNDDRFIISCGMDGYIIKYDQKLKKKDKWLAHKGGVWAIALSSDEKMIISAGEDGRTSFWDFESHKFLFSLAKEKPYEKMNLNNVTGLTAAQKAELVELGAEFNE